MEELATRQEAKRWKGAMLLYGAVFGGFDGNEQTLLNLPALAEVFPTLLSSLSERERRVLELRFGLEDGCTRTLEKVGQEFGVSGERIRVIERKALRHLRHPTRSRLLLACSILGEIQLAARELEKLRAVIAKLEGEFGQGLQNG